MPTFNGTNGDERIFGSTDDDIINGLGGNDFLVGLSGNDIINGGAGDDVILAGTGVDILDGGLGLDILSYEQDIRDLSLNMNQGTAEASAVVMALDNAATTAAVLSAALINNIYFNVHSSAFPGGEIRGQVNGILKEETDGAGVRTVTFSPLYLEGTQEVPSNTSDALGYAYLTMVDDGVGNVTYSVEINIVNLALGDIAAAHLHQAPAGSNGGVVANILSNPAATLANITQTDSFSNFEAVIAGRGNDKVTGDSCDNTIDGVDGDDVVNGADGDDVLF